jgi:hypothetical protein
MKALPFLLLSCSLFLLGCGDQEAEDNSPEVAGANDATSDGYDVPRKDHKPKVSDDVANPDDTTKISGDAEGTEGKSNKKDSADVFEAELQDAAITRIMKLGATVTFDANSPSKPVIGVKFGDVTDLDLKHLEKLWTLRELYFIGNGESVTDEGLGHLKGLKNLQTLVLPLSKHITDDGLKHLRGLTNLRSISLSETQVADAGLVHFKLLKKLQSLDVSYTGVTGVGLENLNHTPVTDIGLKHIEGLTNLQYLNLFGCSRITDAGLEHLKRMTNLEELNLLECGHITDGGLKHVREMTRLKTLRLRGTQVTDAGLEHFRGLTDLQTLSLTGTHVTDAGVKDLQAALPKCEIYYK